MAASILPVFPANYPDDSRFVRQAMATLGFLSDFADLQTSQMQLVLKLATLLKRAQGQES